MLVVQLRQEADATPFVYGMHGMGTPIKRLWERMGKDCERGSPRALAVRLLWDVRLLTLWWSF